MWTWQPFTFNRVATVAAPEPDTLKWWPSSYAVIRADGAMGWADWGGVHTVSQEGKPNIWEVGPHRSFCFGVNGMGQEQRIAPCVAYERYDGPRTYVRAQLDEAHQRLFVYLR